ncbi:MAG: enoyl-CoA hydratase [bacterium]|nr:enoyl-CoA hydratase [bacterium]
MSDEAERDPVILCELDDGVAQITFNRPKRLNAFTPEMGVELIRLFRELDDDDSVRVIIVTGAGRAFCAGADLGGGEKTFSGGSAQQSAAREGGDEEPLPPEARTRNIRPWLIAKPVIAAIQGPAVGMGLTLPLQWDMRIVAEDAKLAFAFVQRGVVTELASTWILPRLVGIARASDLLLTGRTFLGREAVEMGLANEALPSEQVLPRAREIARYIIERCAPASVALTKRLLWEHLGYDDPFVASEREAKGLARIGRLADSAEGVMAFLQKRPAEWKLSARDAPSVD